MDSQRIKMAKKMLLKTGETVGNLLESIDAINAKIKVLEDLGIMEGKEYWRQEKYLTVIEPMRNGLRRRHYIGAKPARIQKALDSMVRWKRRRQLIKDRDTIESKLMGIVQRIENLLATHYHW